MSFHGHCLNCLVVFSLFETSRVASFFVIKENAKLTDDHEFGEIF